MWDCNWNWNRKPVALISISVKFAFLLCSLHLSCFVIRASYFVHAHAFLNRFLCLSLLPLLLLLRRRCCYSNNTIKRACEHNVRTNEPASERATTKDKRRLPNEHEVSTLELGCCCCGCYTHTHACKCLFVCCFYLYIYVCLCACILLLVFVRAFVCVYSTTTATKVPFRLLLVAFTSFFLSFCYSSPPTVSFMCCCCFFLLRFWV